jgi:hypothetical protein
MLTVALPFLVKVEVLVQVLVVLAPLVLLDFFSTRAVLDSRSTRPWYVDEMQGFEGTQGGWNINLLGALRGELDSSLVGSMPRRTQLKQQVCVSRRQLTTCAGDEWNTRNQDGACVHLG